VTTIGEFAFRSTPLASVIIRGGVKTISNEAFALTSSLSSVRFSGDAPAVGVDAFAGVAPGAKAFRAATLKGYGPDGSNFHGLIVATFMK